MVGVENGDDEEVLVGVDEDEFKRENLVLEEDGNGFLDICGVVEIIGVVELVNNLVIWVVGYDNEVKCSVRCVFFKVIFCFVILRLLVFIFVMSLISKICCFYGFYVLMNVFYLLIYML